jgi:hypothetical protein
MRSLPLLAFLFFFVAICHGQDTTRKSITIKRLQGSLKIDGNIDEPQWREGALLKGFFEFRPDPTTMESEENKTEAWILYDNTSIYIGGICHEKNPKNVMRELAGRDNIGASDYVGVIFDTYHDRINGVGFFVTSTGEQYDARYGQSFGEDASWNAVYESEAKITDSGWTFEMKIPYSALRFNKKPSQLWGFNLVRQRQKYAEGFMWNKFDPKIDGLVNQFGDLIIPDQLTPPVRLSFSPYFSTYVNHYPYNLPGVKNTSSSINGGMDVKYGINESFTLDMILIPDFGQVQSDKQVLNLTPFEVKYDENRSFFTEGTELFNKGDLFYSRRVGGTPLHYSEVADSLRPNEVILKNPTESKLINATKISGRTKGGLGIGYFNSITKAMFAEIEDENHNVRKMETQPLSNYNIVVLDQNLKNNSSVTLINTNVLRSGHDYDANVTGFLFNLYNKTNMYNLYGRGYMSKLFNINNTNETGYSYKAGFAKVSGNFNFEVAQNVTDDKYNPNDLGILLNNNFFDHRLYVGYKQVEPGKWYNNMYYNFNLTYSQRFTPRTYQQLQANVNMNGQLKNLWYAGFFITYYAKGNDFYEPRVKGRVFKRPPATEYGIFFNTNRAKRYRMSVDNFTHISEHYGWFYSLMIDQNYRLNDKISFGYQVSTVPYFNEMGFTESINNDSIIFAKRNRNTVENIVNLKYSFNNKMFITTRIRHYWSTVDNQEFYTLTHDGLLDPNHSYATNKNQNVNIFNVDMVYSWRFAPGSELSIVWKNSIYDDIEEVKKGYFNNLDQTFSAPQNNTVSLKVLYYIDYLRLKRRK